MCGMNYGLKVEPTQIGELKRIFLVYINNFNWVSNWFENYFFNKFSDFLLGLFLLVLIIFSFYKKRNFTFKSEKKNKPFIFTFFISNFISSLV